MGSQKSTGAILPLIAGQRSAAGAHKAINRANQECGPRADLVDNGVIVENVVHQRFSSGQDGAAFFGSAGRKTCVSLTNGPFRDSNVVAPLLLIAGGLVCKLLASLPVGFCFSDSSMGGCTFGS